MWGRIEPLMPAHPARVLRWADHRRTLEATAWKYRTGSPWRDLPDEPGSFQTAHKRLLRWVVDGIWERILSAFLTAADDADDIGWTVSVDSTVRRAHQYAAGARKRARQSGLSPPIMRLVVPAVAWVRKSTSPATAMHAPWLSASPRARRVRHRPSSQSWPVSVCRELGREDRDLGRTPFWRTAHIRHARSGGISVAAGSALSFPCRPTRPVVVGAEAVRGAGCPPSTPRRTSSATRSSDVSAGSNSGGGRAMRTDRLAIVYRAALYFAAIFNWARR